MSIIENGERESEIIAALAKKTNIRVVDRTTTSWIHGRKNLQFDEVNINVTPVEGIDFGDDLQGFTLSLLPDIHPIFTQEAKRGILRSFDSAGNVRRPIKINVVLSESELLDLNK